MRSHADVLYRLRRFPECEELNRRMLAVCERVLGPDNEFSSHAYSQIAMVLQRQERWDDAVAYYKKAIEIKERLEGVKDFAMLTNLGIAIRDKNDSIKVLREALEVGRAQHGDEHVNLVSAMYWLAVQLGPDSQEGAEFHRKALKLCSRDLGLEHPYTARSLAYEQVLFATQAASKGDDFRIIQKYSKYIELSPENKRWLRLAPLYVLAGNEAEYESYCNQLLDRFQGTMAPSEAEFVCKACLLLPNLISVDGLPVDVLEKSLKDGTAQQEEAPRF
jgi:tetratricopeptide (TPR) repeat protein